MARRRGRPVENREIGMSITDPAVDLAGLARIYGLLAFGPLPRFQSCSGSWRRRLQPRSPEQTVLVDVTVVRG